jgi:hypothetical protein
MNWNSLLRVRNLLGGGGGLSSWVFSPQKQWTHSRYWRRWKAVPVAPTRTPLGQPAAFPVARVESRHTQRERERERGRAGEPSHEVLNPRPDCPTLRALIWPLTFLPVSQRMRSDSFADRWETNAFRITPTRIVTRYCTYKDFRWKMCI